MVKESRVESISLRGHAIARDLFCLVLALACAASVIGANMMVLFAWSLCLWDELAFLADAASVSDGQRLRKLCDNFKGHNPWHLQSQHWGVKLAVSSSLCAFWT